MQNKINKKYLQSKQRIKTHVVSLRENRIVMKWARRDTLILSRLSMLCGSDNLYPVNNKFNNSWKRHAIIDVSYGNTVYTLGGSIF